MGERWVVNLFKNGKLFQEKIKNKLRTGSKFT